MYTLFKHQQKAVDRFKKNKFKHAFFHDVGIGKTLTALECFKEFRLQYPTSKMLVVCPLSLIETSWADDIKKFTKFRYTNIKKIKDEYCDIFIINPESFITKDKQNFVDNLCKKNVVMCVIDESQKLKNYKSKITKTCLNLRHRFSGKIVMSATPAPNDPSEYWAQMCFLDDSVFGSNFFKFRYYFFCMQRGETQFPLKGMGSADAHVMLKRGFKFKLRDDKKDEFYNRMFNVADFVKKEDVMDLPAQIDLVHKVSLPSSLYTIYKKMEKTLITEIANENVVALNALSKLVRLRQIISGFSKSDTGAIVRHPESSKTKELSDILESIGNKQVMIFAEYHEEIDNIYTMIRTEYPDKKVSLLDGRTIDKQKEIKDFQNKISDYIIAHPLSGGVGLSFNDCDYCIFYSLSYSSEQYYQARGRIHRAYKKNSPIYIHIIADKTIDEIIFDCVKNKKSQMDILHSFLK